MSCQSSPREEDIAFLYSTCVDKRGKSPKISEEERFLERVSFLVQDGEYNDYEARRLAFQEIYGEV